MLTKEELLQKADELREKAADIHDKVLQGVDYTITNTAKTLDIAAEKMHDAADYIRNRETNCLHCDVEKTVKKYPIQSILGGFLVGFLMGKIFLK